MYVCMYVCVYVCADAYVHVYTSNNITVYMCVCVYIYIYIHVPVCVCACIGLQVVLGFWLPNECSFCTWTPWGYTERKAHTIRKLKVVLILTRASLILMVILKAL